MEVVDRWTSQGDKYITIMLDGDNKVDYKQCADDGFIYALEWTDRHNSDMYEVYVGEDTGVRKLTNEEEDACFALAIAEFEKERVE